MKYIYRAKLTTLRENPIYDADTIYVDIDLGFSTWIMNQTLRLYGINAPEVTGEEKEKGIIARDYLRSALKPNDFVIKTYKDRYDSDKKGKYGRWLADVFIRSESAHCDGHILDYLNIDQQLYVNVNQVLLLRNYVRYYDE